MRVDQKERVILEEWLSLCKAAQAPAKPYWSARLLYERYVERTGEHRAGGVAAVELLRERVIQLSDQIRRRALEKHLKQFWASTP